AMIRDLTWRRSRPINSEMMAFIHPIFIHPALGQRVQRGQREWTAPPPRGFVIITISLSEIQQEILPALVKRYFCGVTGGADAPGMNGFDYSGAVVTQGPERKVIFQFGPESAHQTEADVNVGLMGLRREMLRQMTSRFPPVEGGPSQMTFRPPAGA